MKKIVVLGAGESGVGAAILAKDKGFDVFVSDYGKIAPEYAAMLSTEGIPYEEGTHTMARILDADEVVKSPGIARETPVMQAVAAKNIPVISEIEFAGRYTDARMVCITGSNGKTTTTLLIYHILRAAGIDAGLAGNIGNSLALQVARNPHAVYVIELSSFQLDDMYSFRANVAVMLNITPDHLDRYDHKMENYVAAKFRILQNQTPDDFFVYWKNDPIIAEQLKHIRVEACQLPFAEHFEGDEPATVAYVDDKGTLVADTPGHHFEMNRSLLSLNGLHNLYNSLAAALSAGVMDVRDTVLRNSLSDFEGVEHRLEHVADVEGVEYINDSKATNVNSTYYALESMTKPVVLILGGKDKGNDYSEILPLVKKKVRAIIAMGVDNRKIIGFFKDHVPMAGVNSMEDAVRVAQLSAAPGDVVLLSPCCASFDLFKSYEDRGRQFKEWVHRIAQEE